MLHSNSIAPILVEKGAKGIEWKMQKTGKRRITWTMVDGVHTMVEDDEKDYLPCIKDGYKTSIEKDVRDNCIIYREVKE